MHQFALNAVHVGMKSGNTFFITKLFIVTYPTTVGSAINISVDPPAYVDFPRQRLSIGWTQVKHRFGDLFQERGIRRHDVLIEVPNGTAYICPHVQEYLVHLDPMWESHLTYYTSGVQLALTRPGTNLPSFRSYRVEMSREGEA